jgi:hypothetical protein
MLFYSKNTIWVNICGSPSRNSNSRWIFFLTQFLLLYAQWIGATLQMVMHEVINMYLSCRKRRITRKGRKSKLRKANKRRLTFGHLQISWNRIRARRSLHFVHVKLIGLWAETGIIFCVNLHHPTCLRWCTWVPLPHLLRDHPHQQVIRTAFILGEMLELSRTCSFCSFCIWWTTT